jgi:hypothetical protein
LEVADCFATVDPELKCTPALIFGAREPERLRTVFLVGTAASVVQEPCLLSRILPFRIEMTSKRYTAVRGHISSTTFQFDESVNAIFITFPHSHTFGLLHR